MLKLLLPPILGEGSDELNCIFGDEFDERVSWFARGRVCIVLVNDESDGEFRYLHPYTNESDTDNYLDLGIDDTP